MASINALLSGLDTASAQSHRGDVREWREEDVAWREEVYGFKRSARRCAPRCPAAAAALAPLSLSLFPPSLPALPWLHTARTRAACAHAPALRREPRQRQQR